MRSRIRCTPPTIVLLLILASSIPAAADDSHGVGWQKGESWRYDYAAPGGVEGSLVRTVAGLEGGRWNVSTVFAFEASSRDGHTLDYRSQGWSLHELDGRLHRSVETLAVQTPTGNGTETRYTTYDPSRENLGLSRESGESWVQPLRVVRERIDSEGQVYVGEENVTLYNHKESSSTIDVAAGTFEVSLVTQDNETTDTDGNYTQFYVSDSLEVFVLRVDFRDGSEHTRTELVAYGGHGDGDRNIPGVGLLGSILLIGIGAARHRTRPVQQPPTHP